ncbi:MAG: hypothetical protein ACYTF1_11635 [Planctomycetota bacterium]|jgi:hypothetical protein
MPKVAPSSWELKFRFQDPQRVSVELPGRAQPVVYWYMLYTVENSCDLSKESPKDREVEFYPEFVLVTDMLQVLVSEIKVSPEAFQAVKRRSGNPLLLPQEKVLGRLLCGKDRARHSVALWRDFAPEAKGFKIYVSGLSGEVSRLKNPMFDPSKPVSAKNKRHFILRKTLEIPYKFPGGLSARSKLVPQRIGDKQRWIMK